MLSITQKYAQKGVPGQNGLNILSLSVNVVNFLTPSWILLEYRVKLCTYSMHEYHVHGIQTAHFKCLSRQIFLHSTTEQNINELCLYLNVFRCDAIDIWSCWLESHAHESYILESLREAANKLACVFVCVDVVCHVALAIMQYQ